MGGIFGIFLECRNSHRVWNSGNPPDFRSFKSPRESKQNATPDFGSSKNRTDFSQEKETPPSEPRESRPSSRCPFTIPKPRSFKQSDTQSASTSRSDMRSDTHSGVNSFFDVHLSLSPNMQSDMRSCVPTHTQICTPTCIPTYIPTHRPAPLRIPTCVPTHTQICTPTCIPTYIPTHRPARRADRIPSWEAPRRARRATATPSTATSSDSAGNARRRPRSVRFWEFPKSRLLRSAGSGSTSHGEGDPAGVQATGAAISSG